MPTGSGFRIIDGDDLPSDLSAGTLRSATLASIFLEAERVTITAPLTAKVGPIGVEFAGTAGADTVIPAGTVVCSWFVHTDQGDDTTDILMSLNFAHEILGIAPRSEHLVGSSRFEIPGLSYDYHDMGGTDRFTFTGVRGLDGTIVFNTAVGGADVDQMRIFTGC